VREALSSLPWVAKGSIKPDTAAQQVRFGFADKKKWNYDEVKKTIEDQTEFKVGAVLEGP